MVKYFIIKSGMTCKTYVVKNSSCSSVTSDTYFTL